MNKKKVILSVTNDYSADQRIQRIASWLVERGFEVKIIARILPNSLPLEKFPYAVKRMKLLFTKGKFFYLEYQIRLFFELLFSSVDVLTANDLDTLLPNFLIAKLRNKTLIYDTHEYFTQVPELIYRPTTQKIWLKLERFLFPRLKKIMTVNHSLAKIYGELYQKEVHAIYNVPTLKQVTLSKQVAPKILIYQGALNMDRGIELMIEAMRFLPNYELWIVGRGDIENELMLQAKEMKNVVFQGFKNPKDLFFFTQQASLGLSLEKPVALNYFYASPNKVFDYIQAQVPVLITKTPENEAIIYQFRVGEMLEETERTPQQLAQRIKKLCENSTNYYQYLENCKLAAATLCWEKEAEKLKAIYEV